MRILLFIKANSPYPRKTILNNTEYENYLDTHAEDLEFAAGSGAEAIRDILSMIDLKLEIANLEEEYRHTTSVAIRHKIMRRIKVFSGLLAW